MKFKIFQIALTDQEILDVNNGGSNRRYELHRGMFGDKVVPNAKLAWEENLYDHTANVEAVGLEHAFMISNGVRPGNLERVSKLACSLSVGDMLVDENNYVFVVDTFGFQMLPDMMAIPGA
jgi:hypothetical protein